MAFLRFIVWLGKQGWKYASKLPAMVRWAWSHRSTVARWIEIGFTYGTIAQWILDQIT